ncbi:antitoxin VbhA family protein [Lonepinella sp. BR2271]|uniref:antitoxin VbhA family protein n=1 Tax=Lonepinella sp. BR2271 TaxID=3434550 RepID=UPI003F6DC57E
MGDLEKSERQSAVQFAIDNNRLEGLEPSDEFLAFSQDWIDGNLTTEEFGEKIYVLHGIKDVTKRGA